MRSETRDDEVEIEKINLKIQNFKIKKEEMKIEIENLEEVSQRKYEEVEELKNEVRRLRREDEAIKHRIKDVTMKKENLISCLARSSTLTSVSTSSQTHPIYSASEEVTTSGDGEVVRVGKVGGNSKVKIGKKFEARTTGYSRHVNLSVKLNK